MDSRFAHHYEWRGDHGLAKRLAKAVEGDVRFDALTRGLYSSDASIYQLAPIGVVIPRTSDDVVATLEIAREVGVPVLPRGAGTSQCGQTVGHAIVMDTSVHLRSIDPVDLDRQTVWVEPGLVLDHLNASLADHGLFFPVDVATSSRATLGGMTGNNSSGARSIRYGIMADNVEAIDAHLADGRLVRFSRRGLEGTGTDSIERAIRGIVERERTELRARVPDVLRHVAGYNLHRLLGESPNLAELLIGSEGTLAYFRKIQLKLQRRPLHRVLASCRFPTLSASLSAVQHLIELEPHAVELVDGELLRLAGQNPTFAQAVRTFAPGEPSSVLLVEFAGEDHRGLLDRIDRLEQVLGDLGYPACTVRAESSSEQAAVWSVRKAGLNIVMSRPGDRKPVSFVEDCGVPLTHLAEFGEAVTEIFRSHGTEGTWYAHASVGCLHVRPGLSMKDPADVQTMRSIAREVHSLVSRLGGSHSGEHGDGLLRSEFIEPLLGPRIARAFADVKHLLDPGGSMNPGKIVDPPPMDDRELFRYKPGYPAVELPVVLDWTRTGGFQGAVEMCNNNGACRKLEPDSMCPSYRVTREEIHSTRGRANTLRLAMTGQLGSAGLRSKEVEEALDLCVGCKACRRECPTGVDMARMKAEVQYRKHQLTSPPFGQRVMADLPRLAPFLSRCGPLLNLRNRLPLVAALGERVMGVAADRDVPTWHRKPFRNSELPAGQGDPSQTAIRRRSRVILFGDTFNRYFEPENLRAAVTLLKYGGVTAAAAPTQGRPLCCGRTYISGGFLNKAKAELERTVNALYPLAQAGMPIIGLEPSCLLTLRDEAPDLVPGTRAQVVAEAALLLEEFLLNGVEEGFFPSIPRPPTRIRAQVHGHCHQKALGADAATLEALRRIAHVDADPIASSCCGMAGSFGYERRHVAASIAMAELSLLPSVRATPLDEVIVASGFSCRSQIMLGSGRDAIHPVRLMADVLRQSDQYPNL